MKRLAKLAIALAFIGLGMSHKVYAYTTADSLTVTIAPNAFYAVDIDTGNVSLNLGAVDLGASTQTVQPSTVTIYSTFATTDLRLQGAIGPTWSFDDVTTSSDSNKLAAWATFTSVARSSAPTQTGDYFSGTSTSAANSDVVSTSNLYVGDSATDGVEHYENSSGFDLKDMDALPPFPAPSSQSHLWLYFRMPSQTSTSSAQDVTITLTAVQTN